ncbi:MAG: Coenzyme F420 hydrogenase/dehydrogenase, beta subunit C-terminal domain [Candidatus Heimdallarchaeota archaeon]|nr:MAG: Coenzyme F420 hydrogenase/dehydrogenase, beta subunit C-terminal domain [Candidatus Heimdallarchaeota archaeon]
MTEMNQEQDPLVSFRLSKRKLEGSKEAKFATLKKEVIDTGLCSSCGACVASCNEKALEMIDERPHLVGKCTACGVCIHQCPKTKTTIPQLIGNFTEAFRAKSLIPDVVGQDGGVVTSLLIYLIREGMIDGAVVTTKDDIEYWKPKPIIATKEEQILESSGSIYSQSSAVGKLLEAIKSGLNSIAFVGCPCNIDAVNKMQNSPYGLVRLFMRSSVLKIGLFCMDAFSYDRLRHFVEDVDKVPMRSIEKMTISKGKFHMIQEDGHTISHSVREMDRLRSSSCHYCIDFTSENADISVGSVGAPEGYNLVLVRTGLGLEILQDAADNGYIELNHLTIKDLKPVLRLANLKKVQLYTVNRRRSYAFQVPAQLPMERQQIPSTELLVEEKIGRYRRRMVRIESTKIVEDGRNIQVTLKNRSGKVLERVQVRITLLAGELFESHNWETTIREWFPAEALDFEFPRFDDDSEYMVSLSDANGKILTKKVAVADLINM